MSVKPPCLEYRCPHRSTNAGRCEAHQREPWYGTDRDRFPPTWSSIRARILRRDGYRCRHCGAPDSNEVDHIEDPYDHSDENLQTLCHDCHAHKTHIQSLHGRGYTAGGTRKAGATITPTTRRSKLKRADGP